MRKFSVLGVAVLAVLAMAISAGSASATVLCSAEEDPCASANVLPAGSGYGFAGTFTMTGSGFEATCSNIVFGNYTKAKREEFILNSSSKMFNTYGSYACSGKIGAKSVSCSTSSNETPSFMIAAVGFNDFIEIGGTGSYEITLKCSPEPFVTIECAYTTLNGNGIGVQLHTEKGESGEVFSEPVTLNRTKGGVSCPSTVTFTIVSGVPNLGKRYITT